MNRDDVKAAADHIREHLPITDAEREAAGIPLNSKGIPDHVSLEPTSAHFFPGYKKVGVRFDGKVIFNCVEFCVSAGWVRRHVGQSKGRMRMERGRPVAMFYKGRVEPYWRTK